MRVNPSVLAVFRGRELRKAVEAVRAGRTGWNGAFNLFDHPSVKLSWATMEVNHC
jgi:hypothetical protein